MRIDGAKLAACTLMLALTYATPRARADASEAERLNVRLQDALAEREDASITLPAVTVGVGVLAVAVGLGVGSAAALACDTTCEMPSWVGPTIIAGGGIATLGTLWWLHTDGEITELDRQIVRIRDELHALTLRESLDLSGGTAALSPVRLSVRVVF